VWYPWPNGQRQGRRSRRRREIEGQSYGSVGRGLLRKERLDVVVHVVRSW